MAMPGGSGWHSHRELQWISAGAGLLVMETEEAQWLALPGEALLVASNVPHDVRWFGTLSVASLYLEPGTLDVAGEMPCRRSAVSSLMQAAVQSLADDMKAEPERKERRIDCLSGIILDEMGGGALDALALPNPISRGLRTLCLRLRERPAAPSDLDTCAGIAGMSRRTFTRKFHQETGLSFNDWMRRLRALHALKQRLQGQATKQICESCGYSSVNYMHSEVKRILGTNLTNIVRSQHGSP